MFRTEFIALVQELLTIYISLPIKPNAYSSTQY